MLCALTVRRLKPGTFDQFREAFTRDIGADGVYDVVEDFALEPTA